MESASIEYVKPESRPLDIEGDLLINESSLESVKPGEDWGWEG